MQAAARSSSSSASKKVIADISDAVARSCYQARRGKTHAASLSAQEPPKGPKRVTREERRVRVEEFVENYRASNEGKFPSATSVHQQVGGSYYIVRELLQELEYNSRLKSDGRNISFNSESFKGKQGLNSMNLSKQDIGISFEGIKEEMAKTSDSLDLKTKPHLSECHGKTGSAKLDLSSTNFLEDKSGPMASDQSESNKVIKAENPESPKHEHEGSKETNLWGNLKSFADGLRIFWKRTQL